MRPRSAEAACSMHCSTNTLVLVDTFVQWIPIRVSGLIQVSRQTCQGPPLSRSGPGFLFKRIGS